MRTTRVLKGLPATATELAALEGTTVKIIHATLCYLRGQGLCYKTDRAGHREPGMRGPKPRFWDLTDNKPTE